MLPMTLDETDLSSEDDDITPKPPKEMPQPLPPPDIRTDVSALRTAAPSVPQLHHSFTPADEHSTDEHVSDNIMIDTPATVSSPPSAASTSSTAPRRSGRHHHTPQHYGEWTT